MNWTEGALARHSRRKGWNKEAARQKKYFAMARARLQEEKTKAASADRRPVKSTVPLFVPSYIQHSDHDSSHLQLDADTPLTELPLIGNRKRSVRSPNIKNPDQQEHQSLSSQLNSLGNTLSAGEPYVRNHGSTDLEAKRRRLLQKSDWSGVLMQKPLFIEFPGEPSYARPQSQSRHQAIHLGGFARGSYRPTGYKWHQFPTSKPSGRVHIKIGEQSLRWSQGSNTVRSPQSSEAPFTTLEDWVSQNEPSEADSESPTELCMSGAIVDTESDYLEERSEFVIHSSPQTIHQPTPSRGPALKLLGLDWSEPNMECDRGSTVAQIGVEVKPSDQDVKEDGQWKEWLASPGQSSNDTDRDLIRRSVSPGISHYWSERSPRSAQAISPGSPIHECEEQLCQPFSRTTCQNEQPTRPMGKSQLGQAEQFLVTNEAGMDMATESILMLDPPERYECLPRDAVASAPRETSSPIPVQLNYAASATPKVQNMMDLLTQELGDMPQPWLQPFEACDEPADLDEDEMWERFVFADAVRGVEITQRARDAAHEQTLREVGESMPDIRSDVTEFQSTTALDSATGSTLDLEPQPTSPGDLGSSTPVTPKTSCTDATQARGLCDATDSSIIAQRGSASPSLGQPKTTKDRSSEFKFHHPQLFVGRLASRGCVQAEPATPPEQQAPPRPAPKRRMDTVRRSRVRERGRPDIRALPNFDGDPIEDSP